MTTPHTPPADAVARLTKLADDYASRGDFATEDDIRTLLAAYADAVARIEAAFARQCERVRNRKDGEYGPYTNADWSDVVAMHSAVRKLLAAYADAARDRDAMPENVYRGNLRYAFARGAMATGAWTLDDALAAAYLVWPDVDDAARTGEAR